MTERGQFVGIGIDEYDTGDPQLDYPAAEVRAVARLLHPTFTGSPLVDLSANAIRDYLETLAVAPTEQLVFLWAGHGVARGDALWLRTKRGDILATEVITRCVESGASQLLMMIDCCHSGQALSDAHRVAKALLAEFPPKNDRVWIGIIVSSRVGETARDGAFGELLQRLLTEGPRSAEMRRRWSRHNRLIFGDDLGSALIEEWDDPDQQPMYLADGRRWFMIPNPLWDPDAPEEVVGHLLAAARGGEDTGRTLFSGRVVEVDTVVEWVVQRRPGIRVVKGSAGTGKSAIVGRVVSLSNPQERERLVAERALRHRDPGENSVDAHVHARGLTADGAAQLIDVQLRRTAPDRDDGVSPLPPSDAGPRNAHELIGALQRAQQSGVRVPVIVIDGLDEARDSAFSLAEDLLIPMGTYATVIVSTRDLLRERSPHRLLDVLGAAATLDLDAPGQQASQREAIMEFATRELSGRHPSMEAKLIGEALSGKVGDRDSFLRARIAVGQLRKAPVDTSLPNWEEHLLQSIGEAFETDIARIATTPDASMPDESNLARLARTLLVALTWALGAGFPEDEWIAVASALEGRQLHAGHIDWVCEHFGRYIVQDGEADVAVYRIAHESLADYLRSTHQPNRDIPFDPAANVVWDALALRYSDLLSAGRKAEESGYLWRYGYRHAAAAGQLGADQLSCLADDFPALLPPAARAYSRVAQVLSDTGHGTEAVANNRTAVGLYRAALKTHPNLQPDLAMVLGTLGVQLREAGQPQEALQPAEDAVHIYDALYTATTGYDFGLAGALGNLGILYKSLGRLEDAISVIERAVTISETLTSHDQRGTEQLALLLLHLGMVYTDAGRHADALESARRAVEMYRELFGSDPLARSELASAMGHLAICLRNVGRHDESLALTHEVVDLYEQEPNTKTRETGLATAISNLGIGYGQIGRLREALSYLADAVSRYRGLINENPLHLCDLASSLTNLGLCQLALGNTHEAIERIEESVSINRSVAETNPALRVRLAETVSNLVQIHIDRRSPAEALAPALDSITVFRQLADTDERYLVEVVRALDTLCGIYRGLGRPAEGAAAAKDAVDVCRTLALVDPNELPRLSWELAMYATCLTEMGHPEKALDPAGEAVEVARTVSPGDPFRQQMLGGALIELGNANRGLGRADVALATTQEAVDLLRDVVAEDVRGRATLATALGNLALSLRDLGRITDAVAPSEESASILRDLISGNASHQAELARTLINVGALHVDLQDPHAALDAFDEAIAIRRAAESDVPSDRLHLAAALGNRGSCLIMLERFVEAAAAAEEAIELFRQAFEVNPGRLTELAGALTILESALEPLGQADRAEQSWAEAIQSLTDSAQQARLLITRAEHVTVGDLRAVNWLSEAIELSKDDRDCRSAAHRAARWHRTQDPERWETEWQHVTKCPAPDWLSVDDELLSAARTWVQFHADQQKIALSGALEAGRDFLAAHDELLKTTADVAFREAVLALDDRAAERLQAIRSDAMASGVVDTYRPLIVEALLDRFELVGPAEQRVMLDAYRGDLTGIEALEHIRRREETGTLNITSRRAHAILKLATCEGSDRVLGEIFDALDDSSRLPAALRTVALDSAAATLLPLTADIGKNTSDNPGAVGISHLFAAIASAIKQESAASAEQARLALAAAPQSRDGFILQTADIGASQPAALIVIQYLIDG